MSTLEQISTVIEIVLGVGGLAAFFAAMLHAKNAKQIVENSRRLIEILQGELAAHKEGGERLLRERDDYKDKLHACANQCHRYEVENAELRSRTDFTPFSELQNKRHEEQSRINEKMITMLEGMSRLLEALNEKLEVAHKP